MGGLVVWMGIIAFLYFLICLGEHAAKRNKEDDDWY